MADPDDPIDASASPASTGLSTEPRLSTPSPGTGRHDEVDFAPYDLTDGREEMDWASRYKGTGAVRQIVGEGLYLAVLILVSAAALTIIWLGTPRTWLGVDIAHYATFRVYAFAWVAGLLGGTLFAVKWLYHSVGKGLWNADRLAWRLFTPHLSGGFAFALVALATSGIFEILNRDVLRSGPAVVGTGFVLGYFSDFTVARLAKIAENLLGGPHER